MMNKKFYSSLLLGCIIIFFTSCNEENQHNVILTPSVVMDSLQKMSASESARFYLENREEYEFMDELYSDSIIPVLNNCDYYELKDITSVH